MKKFLLSSLAALAVLAISSVSAADRLVLTAKHCVEDQYETIEREKIDKDGKVTKEKIRRLKPGSVSQISFKDAEQVRQVTYRTKLLAVSQTMDLALLQVLATLPNTMESKLACKEPVRGERAYVVGNPKGEFYSSVGEGLVASVQRQYRSFPGMGADDERPLMQVSSGVVPGNSGGSVYNDAGELIGVPVIAFSANENLGFAVPLDDIKAFLKENNQEKLFDRCKKE